VTRKVEAHKPSIVSFLEHDSYHLVFFTALDRWSFLGTLSLPRCEYRRATSPLSSPLARLANERFAQRFGHSILLSLPSFLSRYPLRLVQHAHTTPLGLGEGFVERMRGEVIEIGWPVKRLLFRQACCCCCFAAAIISGVAGAGGPRGLDCALLPGPRSDILISFDT